MGANFDSFKSRDDFARIARALTDPGNHWAIGSNILTWIMQVFRVPNNWRESGGKLTKDIETEEYREAVAYLRSVWDAGVIWPDTPATVNTLAQGFYAHSCGPGRIIRNLSTIIRNLRTLRRSRRMTRRHAGRYTFWPSVPGVHWSVGNGSIGLTVLKKASADRVTELLGILNYLASPFGTQENLLIQYGLKDTDYTINDKGNPTLTQRGQTEIVPSAGLVRRPPVLFDPRADEAARRGYADETAAIGIGIKSPTVALYSNTYAQKGSSLNRAFTDGTNQILYGRDPANNLDQLVQTWRNNGGDQIRAEYEAALNARA